MAFKDSLRLEQIYFQKLKDMIKTCKAWYDGENTDKDRDILEALIQACAAILLLYRNLGEEWNELTALIQRTIHDLVDLKDKTDAYHDELNEKIDEVNNYLNAAITVIEAQIDAFGGLPSNANANEGDVLTVGENHVNEWKTPNGGFTLYGPYIASNSTDTPVRADGTDVYIELDNITNTNDEPLSFPETDFKCFIFGINNETGDSTHISTFFLPSLEEPASVVIFSFSGHNTVSHAGDITMFFYCDTELLANNV